ncbi:hypothetical protein CL618_00235 [archaeon]|nr:hypothetical protein [archaeon]|tara:strand:+ start:210 stop:881 length:672 start_codon:yes stop_codon:yes gene_type:complete
MKTKTKDFIEIEYTGSITSKDIIFDTTSEKVAKDNNIFNPQHKYKTQIICIGEQQVVPGLDEFLKDKEINKDYTLNLPTEKAFHKKNPKLLRLIPTSKFKEQKINPYPGLQVNIDGKMGVIKTAGGGRSIVDFNHPLAGQDITYKVKILKIIKDIKTKLDSLIDLYLPIPFTSTLKDNIATIKFSTEFPDIITKQITEKIKTLIPSIKKVNIEYTKQKDTIKE